MDAEELARALGGTKSGNSWSCRCPAHDDKNPSLSISDGDKGPVWKCHAGCTQDEVTDAMRAKGLLNGDARLNGLPFHHAKLGEPSSTWTYRYANGRLAFVVARYETASGKEIRPWRPNGAGYECKVIAEPRPLYRLPELLADKSKPVLVVEGERCVDAAAKMLTQYAVTTWAGGAENVRKADWKPLAGRTVTIWPDADEAGRKAAANVAGHLKPLAAKASVIEPGERPEGWDVADAIAEGWTADDLGTFIEDRAEERSPDSNEVPRARKQPRIVGVAEFVATLAPLEWVVERILQRRYCYALTAFWGHGKTAIMLTVALYVATGRALGPHRVIRQPVLFLCGENVDDVKLRVRLAAEALGIVWSELESWLCFTERRFAIDNPVALEEFCAENADQGPFGLVVVDTGPAHSDAEEENQNREQHALAMAFRTLMDRFGGPCLVALMHPAKGATKDSMQPRGGGAFSGAIDGELCAWVDAGADIAEFYHRTKFRGPGFKPLCFRLEKRELAEVRDNFGSPALTVIATLTDERPADGPGKRRLRPTEKVALDALRRCIADQSNKAASVPPAIRATAGMGKNTATLVETWRQACYDASTDKKPEARQKAFKRASESLVAARIVAVYQDFAWIPAEPNLAGSK